MPENKAIYLKNDVGSIEKRGGNNQYESSLFAPSRFSLFVQ
jgi:hypothetical protein